MSIVATFNGLNIIALPCDAVSSVAAPSLIEWDPQEMVAPSTAGFDYSQQICDWSQSMLSGQVSLPPMKRLSADYWQAFLLEARGGVNAFLMGDPKASTPKGEPSGTPLVNGASQAGYTLATRGWAASTSGLLLPGDYIQIGYRLYRVLVPVASDSSGDASISIWPNLRDAPADGTAIVTSNCKGLFRLTRATGNKYSTNPGSYGFSGFGIREAL